jgi:hypothetical protein
VAAAAAVTAAAAARHQGKRKRKREASAAEKTNVGARPTTTQYKTYIKNQQFSFFLLNHLRDCI